MSASQCGTCQGSQPTKGGVGAGDKPGASTKNLEICDELGGERGGGGRPAATGSRRAEAGDVNLRVGRAVGAPNGIWGDGLLECCVGDVNGQARQGFEVWPDASVGGASGGQESRWVGRKIKISDAQTSFLDGSLALPPSFRGACRILARHLWRHR